MPVETVELIITEGLPVQALLRLKGAFNHGCNSIGDISIRLDNNTFNIAVQNGFHADPDLPIHCTQGVRYFQKTLALPILGLKAGQYNYLVNKKFFGTFKLKVDNNVPGAPADSENLGLE